MREFHVNVKRLTETRNTFVKSMTLEIGSKILIRGRTSRTGKRVARTMNAGEDVVVGGLPL